MERACQGAVDDGNQTSKAQLWYRRATVCEYLEQNKQRSYQVVPELIVSERSMGKRRMVYWEIEHSIKSCII